MIQHVPNVTTARSDTPVILPVRHDVETDDHVGRRKGRTKASRAMPLS
ncbi:MAG: hypothetical protein P0119_02715 [Nitrospira sp.]|nr:hypothetical protein [Nitrospira sp.]